MKLSGWRCSWDRLECTDQGVDSCDKEESKDILVEWGFIHEGDKELNNKSQDLSWDNRIWFFLSGSSCLLHPVRNLLPIKSYYLILLHLKITFGSKGSFLLITSMCLDTPDISPWILHIWLRTNLGRREDFTSSLIPPLTSTENSWGQGKGCEFNKWIIEFYYRRNHPTNITNEEKSPRV